MRDYQKLLFGDDDTKLLSHMKEQNVSKKMMNDSIKHIKDWFKLQPHLPKIDIDDRFLISMLCFNAFSIEKSKTKIENLFTAKTITPEYFEDRDPRGEKSRLAMDAVEWVVIPKAINSRIVIIRFVSDFVSTYDAITSFKIAFMAFEMRMEYETTFTDEYILDCSQLKLGHVIKITPSILKKALFVIQNCYAAKIKAIHAVNVPTYAISLINLIKATLKKKISERVFVHARIEDLHKHIDVECLPEELGGSAGYCDEISARFYKIMQSDEWRKRLMEAEFERSDESKRPEHMKGKFDEYTGITGSFRKLDID